MRAYVVCCCGKRQSAERASGRALYVLRECAASAAADVVVRALLAAAVFSVYLDLSTQPVSAARLPDSPQGGGEGGVCRWINLKLPDTVLYEVMIIVNFHTTFSQNRDSQL